jgi:hypothetical protein
MAGIKKMIIKETEKEIKKLLKESNPFIGQRLRVLLILKQNEKEGISKREAAKLGGVALKVFRIGEHHISNLELKV